MRCSGSAQNFISIRCVPVQILLVIHSFALQSNGLGVINRSTPCLSNAVEPSRFLVYPDGKSHPVGIPYASWASARVAADVTNILMKEVLGYSTLLLDGLVNVSGQAVNHVAGCLDPNDPMCEYKDANNPHIHITVESWLHAITRAAMLPRDVQPMLLSVLDYQTTSQLYLWQQTVKRGQDSPEHVALDYYKSYRASFYKPFQYFDPWTRIFELVPDDMIVRCSQMVPGTYIDRQADNYMRVTNDTGVECAHGDTVWFSPACRANTTECVPLLLQYNYNMAMQLAFFLEIPVAIVKVYDGAREYDDAYYSAIRRGSFLFDYYQPDDSLVDVDGGLPVMLVLPPTNELEQARQVFKTGNSFVQPRQYCWPQLPAVDKHVTFLASRIDLFAEDMNAMMSASRRLKDRGVDPFEVSRLVACDWVKRHEERWRPWIPAICDAGLHSDSALRRCLPCPPGSYCAGGLAAATPCPPGSYCPANASAPAPCPEGRTTAIVGAVSAEDCSHCQPNYIPFPVSGSCAPTATVFSSIILPVAFLLAVMAVAAFRLRIAQEQSLWRIKEAEIVFEEPLVVLGNGSQGLVVKAFFRGTPVAIKSFLLYNKGFPSPETLRARNIVEAEVGRTGGKAALAVSDSRLRQSMKVLTGIRHPCITTVMGVADLVVENNKRLCLVMELMEFGSLTDLLQNRMFALNGEIALRFLQSITQGMLFLHSAKPPILHGDLKSGNILVDRNMCAKITDFGHLLPVVSDGRPEGNTPYWSAPEILNGFITRSLEADVYSFGIIMHEILTRRCPYENEDARLVIEAVAKGEKRPPIPPGCSVQVAALMDESLMHDPLRRPTFAEIGRRLAALDRSFMTSEAYATADDSSGDLLAGLGPRRLRRSSSKAVGKNQVMPVPPTLVRQDSLLRSMFPPHIAEALMRGERVPPEHKSMITMFFSDVVGFTTISSTATADKVSDLLDRLFVQFDELAEKHGVYKMETIGDAYLCATNVATDQSDSHAARMARFSQEAMAAAKQTLIDEDDPSRGYVEVRVGLHSGPCMASVVGMRSPKYTLLGDTINTASRMESHSLPGRIQCSAVTAELIRTQDPSIVLEPRGRVEIKGKGAMETYWIANPADKARKPPAIPKPPPPAVLAPLPPRLGSPAANAATATVRPAAPAKAVNGAPGECWQRGPS